MGQIIAATFLRALAEAVPYKIRIVLTDNGTHFTGPTGDGWTPEDINTMRAQGVMFRCHSFELACADLGIEHRLTKPRHPWTNGQVERMNRTIKEATVKRFYYQTHDELRKHLGDFVAAYSYARRLKTLRGLTPYEAICKAWAESPSRFTPADLEPCNGRRAAARRWQRRPIGSRLHGGGRDRRSSCPSDRRVMPSRSRRRTQAQLYIAVGCGAALGSFLRFLTGVLIVSEIGLSGLVTTGLVNVVGSFIIMSFATLTGPDGRLLVSTEIRQFVMAGICGGITTFSSMSLDAFTLLIGNAPWQASLYLVAVVTLSLLAAWIGYVVAAIINR